MSTRSKQEPPSKNAAKAAAKAAERDLVRNSMGWSPETPDSTVDIFLEMRHDWFGGGFTPPDYGPVEHRWGPQKAPARPFVTRLTAAFAGRETADHPLHSARLSQIHRSVRYHAVAGRHAVAQSVASARPPSC